MTGVLNYIDGKSFLHNCNPLSKLFLAITMCVSCFMSSSLIYLAGMIVISLLLGSISGISKRVFALFRGLIKISIFLFILQILFVQRGNILLSIPIIPSLSFRINITTTGIYSGLLLVLRLTGATMPLALMLSVTRLEDLSNTMVKNLHIPYKYAFTFTSAVRFIPQYFNDMADIMDAQTARGVELDTKNVFKKLGLIMPLCVPLLLSQVRKIESSAIAAELRGFNLRTAKSCYFTYSMKAKDYLVILAGIILVIGAIII